MMIEGAAEFFLLPFWILSDFWKKQVRKEKTGKFHVAFIVGL